jgi:hypothetical protein
MKILQLLKEVINEVSIEQLQAQFVDTGKISSKTFDDITSASGNKSAYATWLIKRVVDGLIKPEDVYKFKEYLNAFNRRKRDYESSDIATIRDSQALQGFIDTSIELIEKEKQDKSTAKGLSKQDKYADFKIGEVDGFTVYELPKGRTDLYGTSCELGSGTQWCTATGKTDYHFEEYIKRGPLYIFIKGDQKYQFSFSAKQFMDKKDRPVAITGDPYKVLPLFQFVHDLRGYTIPARLTAEPRFRDAEEVFMQFGRIRRGGLGVESTYDELKDKLSTVSRRNADTVAAKLNLTWNTMIIYQVPDGDKMTTLFAIKGTDSSGKEYMYDRAGLGAGGYSKIYSLGGTKENVTNVVSGKITAANFK